MVEEAIVTITGLGNGMWNARWISTYTGESVSEANALASDGSAELSVPAFSRDIALRLERTP